MSSHNLSSSSTNWNNPTPLALEKPNFATPNSAATLHKDHEYCKPCFCYAPAGIKQPVNQTSNNSKTCSFQMPLARYLKSDYEAMPEWKLDCLLKQYGLPANGDVNHNRKFAMAGSLPLPSFGLHSMNE